MFKRTLAVFWVVLLAVCGVSSNAHACMPDADGFGTTNFELVQQADAIVVATPTSETFNRNLDDEFNYGSRLSFRVDHVLKGEAGADLQAVKLEGVFKEVEPSNSNDLQGAHPDSGSGACIREKFQKGRPYVLFLFKKKDGQYGWRREPSLRVSEDYFGEDSLWVSTIRYYLEVQKNPDPLKQLEILKQKYEALVSSQEMTDDDKELALDIKFQVGGISPSMPTAFLIEAYKAIEEGRKNRFAVQEDDKRLSSFHLKKLQARIGWEIKESDLKSPEVPVDEEKARILKAFLGENHADAMEFFNNLLKKPGQSPVILAAVVRYYSQYGRYHEALEILKAHAYEIMNTGSERDAAAFLGAALAVNQVPGDYEKRRWQNDPELRKWWPKFLFGLYYNYTHRFVETKFDPNMPLYSYDEYYKPEAHELRPVDYRTWPEIAIYLAYGAQYEDDPVVDWAAGEIDTYLRVVQKNKKAQYNDFDRYFLDLPVRVLLESYNDKQEQFDRIQRYFCSDKDIRETFLKQLGLVRGYSDEVLVYRFSQYDGYAGEEQAYLKQSIAALAGRNHSIIFYGLAPFMQKGPFDYEPPEEGLGKQYFKCTVKP